MIRARHTDRKRPAWTSLRKKGARVLFVKGDKEDQKTLLMCRVVASMIRTLYLVEVVLVDKRGVSNRTYSMI